jgi:beta-lactamase regulating signal transducer with metallopeptidase domain
MTGIAPVMWMVWGALVVLFMALHVYRGRLSRDEDDQLFLDDAFSHEKAAQAAITAKVSKVQPFVTGAMWAVGAMTLVVIVYYAIDVFSQFK